MYVIIIKFEDGHELEWARTHKITEAKEWFDFMLDFQQRDGASANVAAVELGYLMNAVA